MYTAIVFKVHQAAPKAYQPKQIDSIIDSNSVISSVQLSFLAWIASYYQAPLGLVFRTALPSVMLLESETEIIIHEWKSLLPTLSKNAIKILQQVQPNSTVSLSQVQQLIGVKNPFPVLNELVESNYAVLKEEVYAQYRPKTQTEVVYPQRIYPCRIEIVVSQIWNVAESPFTAHGSKRAIESWVFLIVISKVSN